VRCPVPGGLDHRCAGRRKALSPSSGDSTGNHVIKPAGDPLFNDHARADVHVSVQSGDRSQRSGGHNRPNASHGHQHTWVIHSYHIRHARAATIHLHSDLFGGATGSPIADKQRGVHPCTAISAQPLEKVKVRTGDAGPLPVLAYPCDGTLSPEAFLRVVR